jgi:hypothetical protein
MLAAPSRVATPPAGQHSCEVLKESSMDISTRLALVFAGEMVVVFSAMTLAIVGLFYL